MEHAKKYKIVPAHDPLDDHLSELDSQMTEILKKSDLQEDEKATLYLQVLQKF